MKTAYDIIKRPIITEQSMAETADKKYTFEVAKDANKIEIAKAVEEIFGVKVAKVNTLNMQGKVKRLALKSALSAKAASGDIVVVDSLNLDEVKTKAMKGFLDTVGAKKAVVVTPEVNETVIKSARNIPGVVTTTAKILSVYDIVNAGKFIVDKAALAVIEEVFA